MPTKTCSRCKVEKDTSEFSRRAASRDGLVVWCRGCVSGYAASWRSANEEYNSRYCAENRERIRRRKSEHRAANVERERERSVAYYYANCEKVLKAQAAYRASSVDKRREYQSSYRSAHPDKFRASLNVRRRVLHALRSQAAAKPSNSNAAAQAAALGPRPSADHHIDHILPLSWLDLSNPAHYAAATDPSNVRWLPASENIRRGNRADIDDPIIQSLLAKYSIDESELKIPKQCQRKQAA